MAPLHHDSLANRIPIGLWLVPSELCRQLTKRKEIEDSHFVQLRSEIYLVQHWTRREDIEQRFECHLAFAFRLHTFDARCQTIIINGRFLPVVVIGFDQEPEIVFAQRFDIIG